MRNLLQKYDLKGPRYTSYPAVPFWENNNDENCWKQDIKFSLGENNEIDLYIHIPFCHQLCWYCGCHREIDKKNKKEFSYLETLLKEWQLYINSFPQIKIKSLHLGGGTPNYFTPASLDKLFTVILKNQAEGFQGSIEIDPRVCMDEHLKVLNNWGFTRYSLGIQDLNPDIQKAINRVQPLSLVKSIVKKINHYAHDDINFDLIYGLPKQTWHDLKHSIEQTIALDITSIALYSYAHVPWKAKNQKLIKEDDLLKGYDKYELFLKARDLLLSCGYVQIGMDHFCKKGTNLEKAKSSGSLVRSFMGYTISKAPVLIGIGASSISFTGNSFAQNEKDLEKYKKVIDSGKLPIVNGHVLNEDDHRMNDLIQEIMCHEKWESFKLNKLQEESLDKMLNDGLIKKEKKHFHVTKKGIPFLRNIAMIFDKRLENNSNTNQFSQTV